MAVRKAIARAQSAAQQLNHVCWTRMQTEAGQGLNLILARKELERRTGDGLFCWGVGNAPSKMIPQLARANEEVDVFFSVMKSKPKQQDVEPSGVYVWRTFFDRDGAETALPPHLVVTSRSSTEGGPKRAHYALLCFSDQRLALGDHGPFDPGCFRNAGENGGAVGSSQVTALLRQLKPVPDNAPYRIAFSAKLIGGLWVKLGSPRRLSAAQVKKLNWYAERASDVRSAEWLSFSASLRSSAQGRKRSIPAPTRDLFELT